jgi:hypothetical protein
MLLPSNRAPAAWPDLFGHPWLASAGLDRWAHHAATVVITAGSFWAAASAHHDGGWSGGPPADDGGEHGVSKGGVPTSTAQKTTLSRNRSLGCDPS